MLIIIIVIAVLFIAGITFVILSLTDDDFKHGPYMDW